MDNHLMWHQGNSGGRTPMCSGGPEFQCPVSKRVASDYMRDFFTLSSVLAPYFDPDNHSNMGWHYEKLKEVVQGDIVWLSLMPPKHRMVDVALIADEASIEGADLNTLAGARLTLVGARFGEADDSGVCAPTGSVRAYTTANFPTNIDVNEVFNYRAVNVVTNVNQWFGLGIRIDRLPNDMENMADIKAILAVVSHIYGFDHQFHM